MGRVKEYMMEQQWEESQFRGVVEKILHANGYSFMSGNDPENDDPDLHVPYDFKMERDKHTFLIDIKVYRSQSIDLTLIRNAISNLHVLASQEKVNNIKIVTNVDLPSTGRVGSMGYVFYEVIGPNELYTMSSTDPKLQVELYEALEPLTTVTWEAPSVNSAPIQTLSPSIASPSDFDPLFAIEQLSRCADDDWQAFERACTYAIKGVFDNDFNRWTKPQHNIEDGHQRLDLMGLLNAKHNFWKGLRYDFRSRYVIFEFKNYVDPISQKEIYSTEKYLFAGALRMVAIIIARNGENAGAKKARIGALREHGKLIMLLTQDDLIKVVNDFRTGKEAYNVLIDNLHDMLSGIGR